MTAATDPQLLHISDAADHLGLSQYQLRNLVRDGAIAHTKLGNRVYIPRKAIDDYLNRVAS